MGALFKRRARRANESHPSGVSSRVFIGSCCSHGGIIFYHHQLPSLCRVALFARRACRADESHPPSVSYRDLIGSCYSLRRIVYIITSVSSEFSSGGVVRMVI